MAACIACASTRTVVLRRGATTTRPVRSSPTNSSEGSMRPGTASSNSCSRCETLHSLEHEIDRLEVGAQPVAAPTAGATGMDLAADVVDFAPRLVTMSTWLRQFSLDHPLTDICRDLIGPDGAPLLRSSRLQATENAERSSPDPSGQWLQLQTSRGVHHDLDPVAGRRPRERLSVGSSPASIASARSQHHLTDDGFIVVRRGS